MPRTIAVLLGDESTEAQIPVTIIRVEIPGADLRIHDLDVPLYLNPGSGSTKMAPFSGHLEFLPGPGLTDVPRIDLSDELPLADVTFQLSNAGGAWYAVLAANAYRGAPVTIWQGNLRLTVGQSPFFASFPGVVQVWAGELVHLEADHERATFTAEPPDQFTMPLPRRTYGPPGFAALPTPGTTFVWGYTVVED